MSAGTALPPPSASPAPQLSKQSPWPGLASFTESDQAFFFGREQETTELLRQLLRAKATIIYSRSGLGKTSLLRAGLFPRLILHGYLPVWLRLVHDPKAPPLVAQVQEGIIKALDASNIEGPRPILLPPKDSTHQTLWEYFHQKNLEFWDRTNRPVVPVLVFDQFEEVFTHGRREKELDRSTHFLQELESLLEHRPPPHIRECMEKNPQIAGGFCLGLESVKIIVSLREDFLGELEALRKTIPCLGESRFRLLPMSRDAAIEVVSKAGEGLLAPGAAVQIVDIVAASRRQGRLLGPLETGIPGSVEPALLSVFCSELNNLRLRNNAESISPDLVNRGQTEILRTFYERSFEGLNPQVQLFIEDHLLTRTGLRNRVEHNELVQHEGITAEAIERLVNRRLLQHQPSGDVDWIEMTHDLLTEPALSSRNQRKSRQLIEEEKERTAKAEKAHAEAERLRKAAEKHRTIALWAMAIVVVVVGILMVQFMRLEKAKGNERSARGQVNELMGVQLDIQKSLSAFGRLDLLERLNQRQLDLLPEHSDSVELLSLRAAVIANKSALLVELGDTAGALRSIDSCLSITESLPVATREKSGSRLAYAAQLGQKAKLLATRAEHSNALRFANLSVAEAKLLTGSIEGKATLADTLFTMGDIYRECGYRQHAMLAFSNCLQLRRSVLMETKGNFPRIERDTASTLQRLGSELVQGDSRGAWVCLREAFDIRSRLAGRNPRDTDLREELASSWQGLGGWFAYFGKNTEALLYLSNSLSQRISLADYEPLNLRWARLVADNQKSIGELHAQMGGIRWAANAYSNALMVYTRLIERDPLNTELHARLQSIHNALGDVGQAEAWNSKRDFTNRMSGALQHFQKALEHGNNLLAKDRSNLDFRRRLALTLGRFGEWYLAQRQWAEALRFFDRSQAIREELISRDSASAIWKYDLIVGLTKRAFTLEQLRQPVEAERLLRRAIDMARQLVSSDLDQYGWRLKLAEVQFQLAQILQRRPEGDPLRTAEIKELMNSVNTSIRTLEQENYRTVSLAQLKLNISRAKEASDRQGRSSNRIAGP